MASCHAVHCSRYVLRCHFGVSKVPFTSFSNPTGPTPISGGRPAGLGLSAQTDGSIGPAFGSAFSTATATGSAAPALGSASTPAAALGGSRPAQASATLPAVVGGTASQFGSTTPASGPSAAAIPFGCGQQSSGTSPAGFLFGSSAFAASQPSSGIFGSGRTINPFGPGVSSAAAVSASAPVVPGSGTSPDHFGFGARSTTAASSSASSWQFGAGTNPGIASRRFNVPSSQSFPFGNAGASPASGCAIDPFRTSSRPSAATSETFETGPGSLHFGSFPPATALPGTAATAGWGQSPSGGCEGNPAMPALFGAGLVAPSVSLPTGSAGTSMPPSSLVGNQIGTPTVLAPLTASAAAVFATPSSSRGTPPAGLPVVAAAANRLSPGHTMPLCVPGDAQLTSASVVTPTANGSDPISKEASPVSQANTASAAAAAAAVGTSQQSTEMSAALVPDNSIPAMPHVSAEQQVQAAAQGAPAHPSAFQMMLAGPGTAIDSAAPEAGGLSDTAAPAVPAAAVATQQAGAALPAAASEPAPVATRPAVPAASADQLSGTPATSQKPSPVPGAASMPITTSSEAVAAPMSAGKGKTYPAHAEGTPVLGRHCICNPIYLRAECLTRIIPWPSACQPHIGRLPTTNRLAS